MSKTPKYSERINFFFVIFGKDIPLKHKLNIFKILRSKCIKFRNGGIDGGLLKVHSMSTNTLFRGSKSISEDDSDPYELLRIKECFMELFKSAQEILTKKPEPGKVVNKYSDLYKEMEARMGKIHSHIQNIDKTWLKNYGTVYYENLKFQYPEDLLELLPVAQKVFGRTFKQTGRILGKEEKTIRANSVLNRNRTWLVESSPSYYSSNSKVLDKK